MSIFQWRLDGFHKNMYLYKIIEYSSLIIKVELYWARVGSSYSSTRNTHTYVLCGSVSVNLCHFSISNVRFAFSAFFRKPKKNSGLTSGQNDDPVTRTWKMTQMTHWPGDPMTQFHVWWATFTLRTLTSPHPRWHLDRFSRFSNAHACDTQTTLSCCKSCRWTKHSVPPVLPALPASCDQPEKNKPAVASIPPVSE